MRLSSAQLLTIDSTPVTLITNPGANMAIIPINWVNAYTVGSQAYTPNNASLSICLGSNAHVYGLITPQTYSASGVRLFTSPGISPLANQPMVITMSATGSMNAGPIVTATVNAGGTGYAVGDTGTIDSGGSYSDGNATYQVTSVNSGAVTGFTVTAAGSHYIVTGSGTGGNPMTTTNGGAQPGSGSGFTINVTAVTAGNGTMVVSMAYYIQPTV